MTAPSDLPEAEPENAAATAERLALLYRERAPALQRRIRARLRSSEEASDIVQDAFARLLAAGARQVLRQPEAFLNRIVRNLLIDRARRGASQALHMPIDDANAPMVRPTQEDAIELEEMRMRYREAVDALPERMREVFVLHRVDGLSYRAIAERLEISHRTVEWHVAEAIIRIGRDLER